MVRNTETNTQTQRELGFLVTVCLSVCLSHTSCLVRDVGEERRELALLHVGAAARTEAAVRGCGCEEGGVSVEAVGWSRAPLGEELIEDGAGDDGGDTAAAGGGGGAGPALATGSAVVARGAAVAVLAAAEIIGARGASGLASALLGVTRGEE